MRNILLICSILISFSLKAQFLTYQNFEKQKTNTENKKTHTNSSFTKYLFTAYKKYVSSQDANRCFYSPSCSLYALKASEKYGFFRALPMIFDRLSRCNAEGAKFYPKNKHNNTFIDPP